ncbi:BamA/TamA family outer membrane protein [Chitinispirillales bacterium ANBcel5]|uniref:BamA/TamA family outer membrane protein n=1 Tax=Cellulosispirillum alkaliphilum TaxID=3039283 RepID=UPI002A578F3B|nr:BamA/TamA family outer membrane protein [Chitinispirillales bacterium ANBcel5]
MKFCFSLLIALLLPLSALGFGKNKVQYQQLEWKYMSSPYYQLYFHQNQSPLPEISYRWLDQIHKNLSERFNFFNEEQLPIIIYSDHNTFQQSNIINQIIPEGVGGFTEILKNRVALPFNGSYEEFRHVLHHELVHAFVFSFFSERSVFLRSQAMQVPLWFHEGIAEFLSLGWNSEADMFLMDCMVNGTVPLPGPAMNGYMAYKGGQSFLHFLHSIGGDSLFNSFLRDFKDRRSVEESIKKTFKKDLNELGREWHQELKRLYWPEIGTRIEPSRQGKKVTEKLHGNFHLRPRLSPDGSKIAFFSDVADYTRIVITTREGEKLQSISHHGYGSLIESFYPFRSGVCWSPDGSKIAFIAKRNGKDEIRLVDIEQNKLVEVIDFPFSTISNPDWSPDGEKLIFTAIDNGRQNIYMYCFETKRTVALTNTISDQSHPRFSPDSRFVIYSAQDTSGVANRHFYTYGRLSSNIEIFDTENNETRVFTNSKWNDTYPCFSPQGDSILFVSDRNGINNLYIAPLFAPDSAKPLTDYLGGTSSPDWFPDGTIGFNHFKRMSWDIYLVEDPLSELQSDTLKLTQWVNSMHHSENKFFDVSRLAPTTKSNESTEDTLSSDESIYSQNEQELDSLKVDFETEQEIESTKKEQVSLKIPEPSPYRLSFTPDIVSAGLGFTPYYGMAGQIMLSFSDLMGDHLITTAANIQGNFNEYVYLFLSYFNRRNRVDIGGGGYFSKDYTLEGFDDIFHDTEIGGFLQVRYPFSIFSRLELDLFGKRVKRRPYNSEGESKVSHVALPSLTYTYDDILWGITGPLRGTRARARVTLSPPVKLVDEPFLSFDGDIRSYMHINRRFVWANRLRGGASVALGDASTSARKYFLGGNDNWFNFEVNRDNYENSVGDFFYSEIISPLRGFNLLDITGERAILLNSELRFPFIREISLVWPLPIRVRYINGAMFVDAGNAWDRSDQNTSLPVPPKLYGGFGFGMRANLGMFVLRFDRGWPTDWKRITGSAINYFSLGAEF